MPALHMGLRGLVRGVFKVSFTMATTATRNSSGAQSASFYIAFDGGVSTTLTVTEWEALPKGKLKDVLNAAYGAGDPFVADMNAFVEAYSAAGCIVTGISSDDESTVTLLWSLDGDGFPVLTVGAGIDGGSAAVRVAASYSASE